MSKGPGRSIHGSSLNSSCGRKLSLMFSAQAPAGLDRASTKGVRRTARRRRMSGGLLRVLLEGAQDHGHDEVGGEQDDHEDAGGEAGVIFRQSRAEDYE